jgi:hypothetical protein
MADKTSALDKLESQIIFEPTALDGNAINDRMMRNIAEAESVDDVLEANTTGTLKLEAVANEPVTIDAVSFHESADEYSDGGWGFFCVMQLSDGRVVTTGSRTVVLKLYKIDKLNGFPMATPVVFISNRTRNGWQAWDMTKANVD